MLWVAGYVFATHAPIHERGIAKRCALACLLGCIAYNWAWFPPYPHVLIGVRSTTYFAAISVVVGAYCSEKSVERWWGLPLFVLFIFDVCCHIIRAFKLLDFYTYSLLIDGIGYLQILIFISLGAKGVRNRIASAFDNVRNGMGSSKAA